MAKTHRVSGRAVIIRDRKLLLIRYNDGSYYNFPGGGAEAGETLAECTKRETLEETGITVDVGEMLFTLEIEPERCRLSGDPHISIFFRCTINDAAAAAAPLKPDHSPEYRSLKKWLCHSSSENGGWNTHLRARERYQKTRTCRVFRWELIT